MDGAALTIQPLFSVIVPTHDRPFSLGVCVRSLAQLDFPRKEFEVIVVDDGGSADLTAVLDPFCSQINLRLVRQANAGPAAARNYGAALANGRYLAFTDDDCHVSPGWLSEFINCLETSPDSLIGGKTVNGLPNNIFSAASQLLVDYLYGYVRDSGSRAMRFFTSNNMVMRTANFHKVGGFNNQMLFAAGEDREFCDRWLSLGYEMLFAPQALVSHAHHLTARSFWRQHVNYGRGAYQFHRIRAVHNGDTIQIEPVHFYFQLLLFPFNSKNNRHPWLLSFLFFLSQIANAAGFFREKLTSVEKHDGDSGS